MYYLPVTNQDWINCVQWPQGCSSLMWQGSVPTYCTSLGSRWALVLTGDFPNHYSGYTRWLRSPQPRVENPVVHSIHLKPKWLSSTPSLQKENLQLWYTKGRYTLVSPHSRFYLFTRYIFQIRPDQEQGPHFLTTELNMPWVNDVQSVASTQDIS